MHPKLKTYLVIAFALLVLPAIAFAGGAVIKEQYDQLATAIADYRTALDGNDGADVGTPIDVERTAGNPTIAVSARFSDAAATATITVVYYQGDETTPIAVEEATAEAGRFTRGGAFLAPVLLFDTLGLSRYEVRIDDPSSGTVTLTTWVYGSLSQGAE